MDDISLKRRQIDALNRQWVEWVSKRREIVKQVQALKSCKGIYPHWDPTREYQLFQAIIQGVGELTCLELLSFSLIVEDHASQESAYYPAWSQKVHVKDPQGLIQEMINPIFLSLSNQELFKTITLKDSFQEVFQTISKV